MQSGITTLHNPDERVLMSFDWSQTQRTAERHLLRGQFAAAIEEYRKLTDWNPTDLAALNTLGDLYVRAGFNQEGARIFSRVAQAYRHQGFTSKAIALFKKLLRIDPADFASAESLSECYLAQGLRGDAVRQFAAVADAYERAGREDKALDAYRRMAEIDPSNTSLLMTLGERWIRQGRKQRAHAIFTAAGDEYSRRGDRELALAAYLKARTAQPDDHKTLATIAAICAARGRADNVFPILCEPDDQHAHITPRKTHSSDGLLDQAANGRARTGGISQKSARPSVAAHHFVPAGETNEMNSLSRRVVSTPANAAVTGFELVKACERRWTGRVSARVPLVVISDTGGWREFTETLDVGVAGLKFQLAHPMPLMTELRVSIDMTKWPRTVGRILAMNATIGVVRYCKTRTGQPGLVGVELSTGPSCSVEQFTGDTAEPV